MVIWVIDNLNIADRTFKNSKQENMGSFTPEDLRTMYHFPMPHKAYDKAFLEKFAKENQDPMKVVKEWKVDQCKLKWDKLGMYPIAQLPSPHCFVAVMLCRFFSRLDTTKFSIEWVPLIDAVVNSSIMNWENILSNNLAKTIMEYTTNRAFSTRKIPPFYMSTYIMNVIWNLNFIPIFIIFVMESCCPFFKPF